MPAKLVVAVRVQTRASRNEIVGIEANRLKIRTTAPPTDGRANKDVARQLADAFGVAPSRVALRTGTKSRQKTFIVDEPVLAPPWLQDIDFSQGGLWAIVGNWPDMPRGTSKK